MIASAPHARDHGMEPTTHLREADGTHAWRRPASTRGSRTHGDRLHLAAVDTRAWGRTARTHTEIP